MPETTKTEEILMSILMASSREPKGLSKESILAILEGYGETSLYEFCEAMENVNAELDETEDEDGESLDQFISG